VLPRTPVPLRPQGFAPSRRFAPRAACRAYFIPVPLLGLTLRGFVPHAMPYVLSNAESLRVHTKVRSETMARPSRDLTHHTKPEPWLPGVNRATASVRSLGFSPSEASCLRWLADRMTSPRPLTCFLVRAFELTRFETLAPQGIPPPETQPRSLELGATPLEFFTSSPFSLL
jgi:hypothetical protein